MKSKASLLDASLLAQQSDSILLSGGKKLKKKKKSHCYLPMSVVTTDAVIDNSNLLPSHRSRSLYSLLPMQTNPMHVYTHANTHPA